MIFEVLNTLSRGDTHAYFMRDDSEPVPDKFTVIGTNGKVYILSFTLAAYIKVVYFKYQRSSFGVSYYRLHSDNVKAYLQLDFDFFRHREKDMFFLLHDDWMLCTPSRFILQLGELKQFYRKRPKYLNKKWYYIV